MTGECTMKDRDIYMKTFDIYSTISSFVTRYSHGEFLS